MNSRYALTNNNKKTKSNDPPQTHSVWLLKVVATRIEHTRLTHSDLYNQEEQPICHRCDVPILTIKHLILHCPKCNEERRILKTTHKDGRSPR